MSADYLAGLWEAKGRARVQPQGQNRPARLEVRVISKQEALIDQLVSHCGGGKYRMRDSWEWKLTERAARQFLMTIQPYCRFRRAELRQVLVDEHAMLARRHAERLHR